MGKMNFGLDHHGHSSMIRHWKAEHRAIPLGDMPKEGTCHKLRSPYYGHMIEIRFTELPDHPDEMIVRSTNYRAEHEPNGIYKKSDCQTFYKILRRAGFIIPND